LAVNCRTLVHMSSILVPLFMEATSRAVTVAVLCIVTLGYLVGELLRGKGHSVPLLSEFTLRMSRPNERGHFIVRPIFLALGVIMVLLLFPRYVAYASIAIVAIGDPVAAYVGNSLGRRHYGRKTWEGFAAGTFAGFLPTVLLVPPIVGAVGATVGMLLELTDVADDNLTIPLGSGAVMFLATMILMLTKV
jgi:dolichol kinase